MSSWTTLPVPPSILMKNSYHAAIDLCDGECHHNSVSPAGLGAKKMHKKFRKLLLIALLVGGCALGLTALNGNWFAQTQSDQQSGPGPKPNVGETVIAPKKPDSATTIQPEVKKPERINPNEIY